MQIERAQPALFNIEDVGVTKAQLKGKAERSGFFDDLRNNPEREQVHALLTRRGNTYTEAEIRQLLDALMVTSWAETVLYHSDDFTPIEIWQAEESKRKLAAAKRRLDSLVARAAAP